MEQFPDPDHTYTPNKPSDRGWSQYLAKSIYHTNRIVLTFDDGPHATNTPQILDTLKKFNATAVFFVNASNINSSNEHIVERIIREGHTLASHDWDHTNNNDENEQIYRVGLSKSAIKIKELMAKYESPNKELYYRFPFGDYGRVSSYHHLNVMKDVSQELFGENCINFVFWDIDTADWVTNMNPGDIAQNIKAHIEGGTAYQHKKYGNTYKKSAYTITNPPGGGVVLMHDIHKRSADALPLILEYAAANGIEVVNLKDVEEYSYEENKQCQLLDKPITK